MNEKRANEHGLSRRGFLAASVVAGSALGIGSQEVQAKPVNPSSDKFGDRSHGSAILKPKSPLKEIGLLFDDLKRNANKEELYRFLYALPKGGDIHHHFGGGMLPEMWFDVATDKSRNGDQEFYTRYRVSGYFKTDANIIETREIGCSGLPYRNRVFRACQRPPRLISKRCPGSTRKRRRSGSGRLC